jgi:cell wall-associated NlpC family hydrolase
MYISQETPEQIFTRLRQVIREAELHVHERPYAFIEVNVSDFPQHLVADALAFVRDEDVWSALVPSSAPEHEKFTLFSFHFKPGFDNSGFVGWLASHFKQKLGTGVMVVCGQNSNRGGIFDYWGAPEALAIPVIAELRSLRGE